MIKYGDLKLKYFTTYAGLDFAHYTYGKHQCSCCYGPFYMPARYWKDGKKPPRYIEGTETYNEKGELISGQPREISYILFKNAYNGSGAVTKKDLIEDHTYIGWKMPAEKLGLVCDMLAKQLGKDYRVLKPLDKDYCIQIRTTESLNRYPLENSRDKDAYVVVRSN